MERCLRLAREAEGCGEAPVGAVLERSGEAIAEASEQVNALQDVTAHAELLAIRQACRVLATRDLSDCILYTNVEPCWMCSYAIRETRIGVVVIAKAVPDIGGVTSRFPLLTETGIEGWGSPPEILWWAGEEQNR
jgi:tRNA(adenine34) deaminase